MTYVKPLPIGQYRALCNDVDYAIFMHFDADWDNQTKQEVITKDFVSAAWDKSKKKKVQAGIN